MRIAATFFLNIMIITAFKSYSQGYISPFKNDNGKVVPKSRNEIIAEESKLAAYKRNADIPKEFEKPKSGLKSNGEVWIGGYCRYRPPGYSTSRYDADMSEKEFCTATYPYDTVIITDDFISGNYGGWIPVNSGNKEQFFQFLKRMDASINEGLAFPMFDSLTRLGKHDNTKEKIYQFNKSVSLWIKRKSGSEKSFIKLQTLFPFSNGEDYTYFEVNDKGQFKISAFCDNCKDQFGEKESGRSKAWKESDWNEITVMKDQFNTVTFYINQEKIYRYRIPDIPFSVRFSSFRLEMPYKWEKEKLMYTIGAVTSISYPKTY